MVDYKIVKFCRLCKVRYVVPKSESKKNYCDACQIKMDSYREAQDAENEAEEKRLEGKKSKEKK